MAGPSNSPPYDSPGKQELHYLHAINVNFSNFVSVKLSGNDNYHLWKTQMLCLMETHNMRSLVDGPFDRSSSIMKQYDSLLKGWIFGSVSQRVLGTVVDLGSAKDVWDKLKSFYAPNISFQQDSAQPKLEEKKETKGKGISTETEIKDLQIDLTKFKSINTREYTNSRKAYQRRAMLRAKQMDKDIEKALERAEEGVWEAMDNKKNTVLHLAVEKGHDHVVYRLLDHLKPEDVKRVLEMKNVDGSTALHVAAIVGNRHIATLLVKKHKELLTISDNQGHDPLSKAYSNLQFDTCIYLLLFKAMEDNKHSDQLIKIGVDLVVYAISAKQYRLARYMVDTFPQFATESDQVLMAIARTYPSGLCHDDNEDILEEGTELIKNMVETVFCFGEECREINISVSDVPQMLLLFWELIHILITIVFLPIVALCLLLSKLGSYMNRTKKGWKEAKKVLKLVCDKIDKLKLPDTHHHPYYKGPILEAACQNAYEVVDEILSRSPQVIKCQDKCGHDIIQLAVIHRSDKIYNRIYQNGEGNNQYYKTIKDSSLNNMLHLAGRLAPSHKLNRITGAALQLQRELQWREELKKFVFPAYITQENIYKETPGVVFTREHENLVKEGETWMKTTAESCSITAGLITTIVFAAAITVPGGSNQEKGTPLFRHEIAFIIFAISDAISLFTSTITLLVFLSILTARFSEQDFLVSLPRRLIIGLCSLLVSTTAMMVAFGAILFLVFGHKNPWMLVPICTTVCLTIVFFFIIQFPLIADLYRSTYVPIFGNKTNSQHQEDRHDISLYEYVSIFMATA